MNAACCAMHRVLRRGNALLLRFNTLLNRFWHKTVMLPTDAEGVPLISKDGVPIRRNDWLTNFCRTIAFITSMCALLCLMAFATAIFHDTTEGALMRELRNKSNPGTLVPWETQAQAISESFLRVVGVVCSVVVILAETEWERFLQHFAFLDYWISRGFFQLGLAALTQCMAHAEGSSDLARSVSLYRNFAATSLALVGIFYMFSGMVCIGAMRRARRRQEMERLAMLRDLQDVERQLGDVERRRMELKSLLEPDSSRDD